jgi:hypothetical protein
MFLSAGQTSDYIGARALLPTIPQAGALLADRGYDADWFRNALIELGISPCIPSKLSRTVQIPLCRRPDYADVGLQVAEYLQVRCAGVGIIVGVLDW